jgi:hypothetical protein
LQCGAAVVRTDENGFDLRGAGASQREFRVADLERIAQNQDVCDVDGISALIFYPGPESVDAENVDFLGFAGCVVALPFPEIALGIDIHILRSFRYHRSDVLIG